MQLPERTLNNGLRIPGIGFGTYKSTGEITGVLDMAIEAGYRYFDTASFYENEGELGERWRRASFQRGIPGRFQGMEDTDGLRRD